jgi:Concanavalin A-like lectin/glucanases superfamily
MLCRMSMVLVSIVGLGIPAYAQGATPVTTSALDTGPNSELVSSVPIYKTWEPSVEKVVYSLPIPSVRAGETLRATGNVELSGSHSYGVSASERLVIGSSPSNAEGTVVTPRANTTMTPEMSRLTLPIDGVYRPTADLGTQYLKLVVKAPASAPKEGDTLSVVSNSGRLAVTRYAPTMGPTSLPTDELQSCTTASEQITTIPVDSNWHSALSCDMGEISTEDLLELSGQMEVGNINTPKVKLESLVIASTTATGVEIGTNGYILSDATSDTLTSSNRFARLVQSNEASTNSASKHYVNLLVRATPAGEGSFTPLSIEAESAMLNVLRFKPKAGNPLDVMRPGTLETSSSDPFIDKSTVPFAAEGKAPVVVNSIPIHGLAKEDVIRAHGVVTADLNGGGSAPVETELVLAETKTATTGETVARRSGDTIPTTQQIHTINKNVTFVATKASIADKYLNLIVYANREPGKSGEELKLSRASVAYSRSQLRTPFSDNFEDGSLDQFFHYGQTNSITSNQAREGTKSMQTDVDSNSTCNICGEGEPDPEGVRRAEIVPPDRASSGGFAGEDRWYGWSVYFPESFKTPAIDPSYFTGKIDEVRLYNQSLSEGQIKTDQAGEYAKTGATPVAAYPFSETKEEDEKNGITHDSTAGHHDGAIEGATWTGSGKYGSALEFNGLNSLVRIADSNELDLTKSFTLEAWVDPTDASGAPRWWDPLIGKTEGEEHSASGYLLNAGFHHFPAGFAYNAGAEAVVGGLPEKPGEISELPTNSWSHLALTSDGEHLKIYVNGELKSTKPAIAAAATGADLTIGTNHFNPEMSGTWDAFTQWHHSNDGVECSTDTSVPIGFGATRYPAGFKFRPGDTPLATAGEYIDVGFNGGQLEEVGKGECHSVKPTERYILAPIHRGQWYDFVVHTRWTTEEGGPGNSVTSVWINGKQVLGNQTIPVAKPTLYWKGSPAVHNSNVTWQWGLYRGPSQEDPPTRLFVDSARTGESYAEVAPEVHVPRIEAESYPATLKGKGLKTFTTSFGAFECAESGLQASEASAARQFALSAEYSGCTATKSKTFSTVTMNSCHYNLAVSNAGPPYLGSWGVACEKEGDAIELKAFSESGGSLLCTAKVSSQAGLAGLGLLNTGEGAKRGIAINGEIKGVKYELNGGSSCKTPEVRTDGVFSGEAALTATNSKAEQIGAHLTGDEFLPKVEAETYPATLKGGGLETFTTKSASITCSETGLQGVLGSASSQLSLTPTYAGCKAAGLTTTANASNCHYILSVKEAGAPYAGKWGIACKESGEVIEFDVFLKSSIICKVKVSAQEGLEGVGLSTSGSGNKRSVGLEAEIKGVKYELSGSNCGTASGTYTDGVLKGKATLAGATDKGAQVGAYLAGEP